MRTAIVAAAAMMFSSIGFAQTCADPIEIFSNNTPPTFGPAGTSTCGAANAFPSFPGGIASPQSDIVYFFVADSANATISVDATGSPLAPGLIVLDACTDTANFIDGASGAAGESISVSVSGLTDGTSYFVIVTSAPGSPDDNCGDFAGGIVGQLPVELSSFSID